MRVRKCGHDGDLACTLLRLGSLILITFNEDFTVTAGQEMEIQLDHLATYVIAFSSWDNPIELKVVKSNSEPLAVLKKFLLDKSQDWSDLMECQTVEDLQEFVLNCDCEISIIEVR